MWAALRNGTLSRESDQLPLAPLSLGPSLGLLGPLV